MFLQKLLFDIFSHKSYIFQRVNRPVQFFSGYGTFIAYRIKIKV
ncbi:hypothetical protein D1BOALGB6SA_1383 [Olavius sp. associated proteobacterium Delta 1]|nr:hypothetical protein D1BOALGB6SA_1383 [Olavius sp. associated proteobacterium Delta 1]